MQFIIFVVALTVTVGIIGICGWAFAQSFVYLCKQLNWAIIFFLNRIFVPSLRILVKVFKSFSALILRLLNAIRNAIKIKVNTIKSMARSEQAVIVEEPHALITEKAEVNPTREHPEIDWSVYDTPTCLRKGENLVW
ncbi:hypothetical protein [Pseudoalteromonas sp. TAB23]|uniref:hypothetical protein n=1 Tax=Pseudoalteromonas sp. TAB23 TaxID=1938595 RepID=UPI000464B8DB|nr:hypothetical protein [Pseudoalteromonas sp. TAB23]